MNVQEYLDLVRHTDENDRLIQEYNAKLIDEYPFLDPRKLWVDKTDDYDYSYTEMDAMPEGWRIAFGDNLLKELKEELIKSNCLDEYRVLEIKEKYGNLRWYDNISSKDIYNIIHKYEDISARTCIHCGKPATKISTGWISPWCNDCAKELSSWESCVDIEDWFNEDENS